MPIRESPNLVNQLTIPKCLYQTVTQTLAQSLCGYRCVIYTCSAPMCYHGVCLQGLHSTRHLQHPTQELAIRVATLTLPTSTKPTWTWQSFKSLQALLQALTLLTSLVKKL